MTYTAIISAIVSVSSTIVYIPVGFAKIFPVQHLANVLTAVLVGPYYAVIQALLASTIRNIMGTGSLFAFPGSMIGALFAGFVYSKTKNLMLTAFGEVIGTGIFGAMAAYPIATLILGQEAALFGLVPAFIISSFAGAAFAFFLLSIMERNHVLKRLEN
ncbi:energy coupling factor transporter S component ThiW [Lysinibacillus odysseyi]|nr:energy coupling factor transporter S component ThiW [Lysinibacillus odysseyi]